MLFPNYNLRPKHHYITHYADLILKFGPLRHLWTLRYESKHRYFKSIVKHLQNYKNISCTLSEKHQLLQTLLASQGTSFSNKIISDNAIEYFEQNYSKTVNRTLNHCCNFNKPTFISNNAIVRGIRYKQKTFVSCYKTDYGTTILCEIQYIIIDNNYTDQFFFGKKCEILLNADTGIYEKIMQNENGDIICININDINNHEPMLHYKKKNYYYFRFKQASFEYLKTAVFNI